MDAQTLAAKKEEFLNIYREHITRAGSDKLLSYLLSEESDFFTAPASTRYHGAYEGGLLEHSLNVYHNLKAYLARERVHDTFRFPEYSGESIAVCALLHDLCKVNFYVPGYKNQSITGMRKMSRVFGRRSRSIKSTTASPTDTAKNPCL